MFRTALGSDLGWGAKRGVLLGIVFSAVLGAVMFVRGSAFYGQAAFLRTVAVATTLGLLGGICVGFLKPLTTRQWGAVMVGALAGIFAFAAVFIVVFGLDRSIILPASLVGILVGGRAGGLMARDHPPGLPS